MTNHSSNVLQAAAHLAQRDAVLGGVIRAVGPCTLEPHTNYYQELVQSILGQQLSLQAAAAIEARLVALFEGHFPSPEQLVARSADDLRTVGLSRAKAAYVQDLAQRVADGRVSFDAIDSLSDADIIRELTAVKGIGDWTVHMFLIFSMGRLDVLPIGDLGIKNGIRKLYGMPEQPSPGDITRIASENGWHPYASIASWYVWQSLTMKA